MTGDPSPELLAAIFAAATYLMVSAGLGKKRLEWRPRGPRGSRCRSCGRRICRHRAF